MKNKKKYASKEKEKSKLTKKKKKIAWLQAWLKKFLRPKPPEHLWRKRENKRREKSERGELESVKKCAEFRDVAYIYRGWVVQKIS